MAKQRIISFALSLILNEYLNENEYFCTIPRVLSQLLRLEKGTWNDHSYCLKQPPVL